MSNMEKGSSPSVPSFKIHDSGNTSEPPLMEVLLKYFILKTLKPFQPQLQSTDKPVPDSFINEYLKRTLFNLPEDTSGEYRLEADSLETDSLEADNPEVILPPPAESDSTSQTDITAVEQEDPAQSPDEDSSADARNTESNLLNSHRKNLEKHLGIHPHIIDTHRELIALIKLPDGIDESGFSIDIGKEQLAVRWKSGYTELLVPLPKGIDSGSASAFVLNGVLEIRIPKSSRQTEKEISIRQL